MIATAVVCQIHTIYYIIDEISDALGIRVFKNKKQPQSETLLNQEVEMQTPAIEWCF